jgi:hypothetical protein
MALPIVLAEPLDFIAERRSLFAGPRRSRIDQAQRDPPDARRVLIEITGTGRRYVADDRRLRPIVRSNMLRASQIARDGIRHRGGLFG